MKVLASRICSSHDTGITLALVIRLDAENK